MTLLSNRYKRIIKLRRNDAIDEINAVIITRMSPSANDPMIANTPKSALSETG